MNHRLLRESVVGRGWKVLFDSFLTSARSEERGLGGMAQRVGVQRGGPEKLQGETEQEDLQQEEARAEDRGTLDELEVLVEPFGLGWD